MRPVSTLLRLCPSCDKPNTPSVSQCTKCSASLSGVGVIETPGTAFDALLHSLDRIDAASSSFPLALEGHTVRRVTTNVVVFDDKFKIAPQHVLAIPRHRPELEDASKLRKSDGGLVLEMWREAYVRVSRAPSMLPLSPPG